MVNVIYTKKEKMKKKVMVARTKRFCDICGKETGIVNIKGNDYCQEHFPEHMDKAKQIALNELIGATIIEIKFRDSWSFTDLSQVKILLKDNKTQKIITECCENLVIANPPIVGKSVL